MKNICPFCKRKYIDSLVGRDGLEAHLESEHKDQCQGLPGRQVLFNIRNKYEIGKKYGVSIILIKSEETIIEPLPETVFEKGDSLFIIGSNKNIDSIENKIAEIVDLENRFIEASQNEE